MELPEVGQKAGGEGPWRGLQGSINPSLHSVLVHYSREKISMF